MGLKFPTVLVLFLVTCTYGDQDVKISKTVPKRNGKVLLKAKCIFRISEKIEIGDAQFTITMDTELTRFKSKHVTVVSEDGNSRLVENAKPMRPDKYVAIFSGFYVGDANTPVPTGTCSDLTFPGTTTAVPSTTSSTSATSTPNPSSASTTTDSSTQSTQGPDPAMQSVPAMTENDTSEGRCHTIQVACNLKVDTAHAPDTVFFNLTFSRNVGRFQDNYGNYISQASEPGLWIYTSNKFQLDPPSFKYAFQVSYHGDSEPEIYCNSILPATAGRK